LISTLTASLCGSTSLEEVMLNESLDGSDFSGKNSNRYIARVEAWD
jgi:hypothetical protein